MDVTGAGDSSFESVGDGVVGAATRLAPDDGDERSAGRSSAAASDAGRGSRSTPERARSARYCRTARGDNAAVLGAVLHPDGAIAPFQNGRRRGRWQLDPSGRALRVGSSRLDLGSAGPTRIAIDNDKRRYWVDLEIAPGAGQRLFAEAGYAAELLHLGSPVEGRIQVSGMEAPLAVRGRATVTHTWGTRAEGAGVQSRFDLVSQQQDPAVLVSRWAPPGAPARAVVALAAPGPGAGDKSHISVAPAFRPNSDRDYPIPTRFQIDGERLEGVVSLGGTLQRRNPLDALPTPIRMVYSFGAQPQRIWVEAAFDLLLKPLKPGGGSAARRLSSPGVATLNYLEPTPAPAP